MTKYEAHIILNQVREGVPVPRSMVTKALATTGDLNGCLIVDNSVSNWSTDRTTAPNSHPLLPDMER